jgi:GT2 family glycosyltransferase
MKTLVCKLIYGNRSRDILFENELKAGHYADYIDIDIKGIANALNEGIDYSLIYSSFSPEDDYEAIAFLANDIIEPQDWLAKKIEALTIYPDAGVVASSLDHKRTEINSELIISNWLISAEVIKKIGYFNEDIYPYGPIDLDYCERAWAAGFKTYYVKDCLAVHTDSPVDYGWSKSEIIKVEWEKFNAASLKYKSGELHYYKKRKEK